MSDLTARHPLSVLRVFLPLGVSSFGGPIAHLGFLRSEFVERRAWLSDKGYYVRRLNTAYLSFYGAYAGTDNPYEARLRRLRQRSGSLQEFLLVVGSVDSVESFERVAGH